MRGSTTYRILTDHLKTPRKLIDVSNATVWSWDGKEAFGSTGPSGSVTFNLRFPGQYADTETGLFNNGFRDYAPAWGRYVESDPTGLGGGLNTYGYVGGNPVFLADPSGQSWQLVVGAMAIGVVVDAAYQMCADRRSISQLRWNELLLGAGMGLIVGPALPEGLFFVGDTIVVTRWAPVVLDGLEPGDWVMTGSASFRNYAFSGVGQYGYEFSNAFTTTVDSSQLSWPSGTQFIKGLLGQRIYTP